MFQIGYSAGFTFFLVYYYKHDHIHWFPYENRYPLNFKEIMLECYYIYFLYQILLVVCIYAFWFDYYSFNSNEVMIIIYIIQSECAFNVIFVDSGA